MNKKIKLYHFSDKKFDKIKISKFGDNYFTLNDTKDSNIKRSFFYLENKAIEYRFDNSKYTYIVKVAKNKLYDLRSDKLNLKYKYQGNIDGLLKYIRRDFLGCIYNVGYNIAILFKDIKVNKIRR